MNFIFVEENKEKLFIKIIHSKNWFNIIPFAILIVFLTAILLLCISLAFAMYKELFAISLVLLIFYIWSIKQMIWLLKGESELHITSKTLFYFKKFKPFTTPKELLKSDLSGFKVNTSNHLSMFKYLPLGKAYLRLIEKIDPNQFQMIVETPAKNKIILERLSRKEIEALLKKIVTFNNQSENL